MVQCLVIASIHSKCVWSSATASDFSDVHDSIKGKRHVFVAFGTQLRARNRLGILEEPLIRSLLNAAEPNLGHLVVARIVGVCGIRQVGLLRTVGGVHIHQDDSLLLGGLLPGNLLDLRIHLFHAGLNHGVEVDEERGQDDSGVWGCLPEILKQVVCSASGAVELEISTAVVGASVDDEDVGETAGHGGLGLGLDLVDEKARPALDVVVLHGAVLARPDHVDGVAAVGEEFVQVVAVAVAGGGALAVGDGCTEGHDTQGNLGGVCLWH